MRCMIKVIWHTSNLSLRAPLVTHIYYITILDLTEANGITNQHHHY